MSNTKTPLDWSKTPEENLKGLLRQAGYPDDIIEAMTVDRVADHADRVELSRGVFAYPDSTLVMNLPVHLKHRIQVVYPATARESFMGDVLEITHPYDRINPFMEAGHNAYNAIKLSVSNTATKLSRTTLTKVIQRFKLEDYYEVPPEGDPIYETPLVMGKTIDLEFKQKKENKAHYVVKKGQVGLMVSFRLDRVDNPTLIAIRFAKNRLGAPAIEPINNTGATNKTWNKQINRYWLDANFIQFPTNRATAVQSMYREDKANILKQADDSLYTAPSTDLVPREEIEPLLGTAQKALNREYTKFTVNQEGVNQYTAYRFGDGPSYYIERRDLSEAIAEFDAYAKSDLADSSFWQPLNRTITSLGGGNRNAWVIENRTRPVNNIGAARSMMNRVISVMNDNGWNTITEEEQTNVTYPAKPNSLVKCFRVNNTGAPYAKGKVYIVVPYG